MKLIIFTFLSLFIVSCSQKTTKNSSTTNSTTISTNNSTTTVEQIKEIPTNIEFPSLDGLIISASVYEIDPNAQTILLCHQAGYNRHEYDEIAPKLNDLGFNCISIDQRSGGILNDIMNETTDRAITIELPVEYTDAEQDIIAAIDFSYQKYGKNIILWGSSYSAALALHIGAVNEKVKAVIAFSPGDYLGGEKPLLTTIMQSFKLPFFITSSRAEIESVSTFLGETILDKQHVHFAPKSQGKHGSRALWENHEDNTAYWKAIQVFLKQF